jgi:hypothetical protein
MHVTWFCSNIKLTNDNCYNIKLLLHTYLHRMFLRKFLYWQRGFKNNWTTNNETSDIIIGVHTVLLENVNVISANFEIITSQKKKKKNSMVWVRERTIPTSHLKTHLLSSSCQSHPMPMIWEDNIKMDFKESVWNSVSQIYLVQNRDQQWLLRTL